MVFGLGFLGLSGGEGGFFWAQPCFGVDHWSSFVLALATVCDWPRLAEVKVRGGGSAL